MDLAKQHQDQSPTPPPPPLDAEHLYTPIGRGGAYPWPTPDALAAPIQLIYHTSQLKYYFANPKHGGKLHGTLGNMFRAMTLLARSDAIQQYTTDLSHPQVASLLPQLEEQLLWEPTPPDSIFHNAAEYLHELFKTIHLEANTTPKERPPFGARNYIQAWQYCVQYVDNTIPGFLLARMEEIVSRYTDCGHSHTEVQHKIRLTIDPEEKPVDLEPGDFMAFRLSQYIEACFQEQIIPDQFCRICKFGRQPCARTCHVQRLPPYLMIVLERFNKKFEKTHQPVIIDTTIGLFGYAYELNSAVLHKGTVEASHYFTLVHEGDNHQWVLLDDARVLKGLRGQIAKQMLDSWAHVLMYRLLGPTSVLEKPDEPIDSEVAEELKKAYEGIEDSPQLDTSERIISQSCPVKPAILQVPDTSPVVLQDDDADEALSVLDEEIARIRKEMELTCEDYDIYSVLRQHAASYIPTALPTVPYCGLENRSLICFSNSVLQVFYICPEIRTYLVEHGSQGPVHQLLANLFTVMEMESQACLAPVINAEELFVAAFRQIRPEFIKGTMHDAQEYLSILLELVHQEANVAKLNQERRPKEAPEFASAQEQWTYQRLFVDDSPLASLLMGQLQSTLICLTCGRNSRSWNAIWQLQLQLQSEESQNSTLSVAECIKEFLALETLGGDSAPTCAQCKSPQPCTKELSICKTPRYLLVHLKRFQASGRKLHRHVNIDTKLVIAGQQYALDAAVCHKGNESMGHYYTLLCEKPGLWTQLDDETIRRPLSDEAAEEMLAPFAYLVLYKSASTKIR